MMTVDQLGLGLCVRFIADVQRRKPVELAGGRTWTGPPPSAGCIGRLKWRIPGRSRRVAGCIGVDMIGKHPNQHCYSRGSGPGAKSPAGTSHSDEMCSFQNNMA
jgi:hypothetical protein